MADSSEGTVVIEDARLVFRNFAGKEQQYNREGDRNFSVLLDDGVAENMLEDGWNIKYLKPRPGDDDGDDEGDTPAQAYLQVTVGYKGRPPKIAVITSRGRTNIGEDEIEMLDWADIKTADLIVRPYEWAVNGKTGVKAYLKSLFVTIDEDYLERKYADLDEQ